MRRDENAKTYLVPMLRTFLAISSVAIVAILVGCGHGGPMGGHWDPQNSRVCADDEGCYRVGPLGRGWRMIRQEQAEVAFFNEGGSAVIQSNATCKRTTQADSAPLSALTEHLLIGYTERKIRSQDMVPLAKREALHTVVDAKIDGVPMVLDLYVLRRNGCIYDFSYAAPPERAQLGKADFEQFVAGFVDERRM